MSLLICLEVIAEGEGIDTGPVADLSLRTHREGPLHESALPHPRRRCRRWNPRYLPSRPTGPMKRRSSA